MLVLVLVAGGRGWWPWPVDGSIPVSRCCAFLLMLSFLFRQ